MEYVENNTFKRDVELLLKIKDAYPKILITRTRHDSYLYDGIQIVDISSWLLQDNCQLIIPKFQVETGICNKKV